MCVVLVSIALRKSFFGYIDRKQSEKCIEKGSFLHCTPNISEKPLQNFKEKSNMAKKMEQKQQTPKFLVIRPITRLDWISIARMKLLLFKIQFFLLS